MHPERKKRNNSKPECTSSFCCIHPFLCIVTYSICICMAVVDRFIQVHPSTHLGIRFCLNTKQPSTVEYISVIHEENDPKNKRLAMQYCNAAAPFIYVHITQSSARSNNLCNLKLHQSILKITSPISL